MTSQSGDLSIIRSRQEEEGGKTALGRGNSKCTGPAGKGPSCRAPMAGVEGPLWGRGCGGARRHLQDPGQAQESGERGEASEGSGELEPPDLSEAGKSALGCSAEDSLDRRSSEEPAAGVHHGHLCLQAVQEPDDPADGRGGGCRG